MLKVGLVGEDPNDTGSIKKLLERRYKSVQFCTLVQRFKGSFLDTAKFRNSVKVEVEYQKCNFIVYIRDLDGFASEVSKLKARHEWFNELNSSTGNNNLFLLNIWELEALIFADIDTFNKEYQINHNSKGDPQSIKEPKEELMRLTRKGKKQYKESHCPTIFSKLDISTVERNCKEFRNFIERFEEKVNL